MHDEGEYEKCRESESIPFIIKSFYFYIRFSLFFMGELNLVFGLEKLVNGDFLAIGYMDKFLRDLILTVLKLFSVLIKVGIWL